MKENILVTGCAGFIGMHLCKSLMDEGNKVLGIDNLNDYYDVKLKHNRLSRLKKFANFSFLNFNISNLEKLNYAFEGFKPDKVVNLAAQAGVRYSLENPHAYIETNIVGFMNILECCKTYNVLGLIYASSSSVYGGNKKTPFSVDDRVDNPISIYAVTKKTNELMAYSYSHLYNLNTTGLRFFTVYGPWGRPDMAIYIFTKKIIEEQSLPIFNKGNMYRDFTYIDDIIVGIKSAIRKNYKCEVFNIGNNKSEYLMDLVNMLEQYIGKRANIKYLNMQPGDVKKTHADINYSQKMLNFSPTTSISKGIPKFIDWYMDYITKISL